MLTTTTTKIEVGLQGTGYFFRYETCLIFACEVWRKEGISGSKKGRKEVKGTEPAGGGDLGGDTIDSQSTGRISMSTKPVFIALAILVLWPLAAFADYSDEFTLKLDTFQ